MQIHRQFFFDVPASETQKIRFPFSNATRRHTPSNKYICMQYIYPTIPVDWLAAATAPSIWPKKKNIYHVLYVLPLYLYIFYYISTFTNHLCNDLFPQLSIICSI